MDDETEPEQELRDEVEMLSWPFVLRTNRVWISIEVPNGKAEDPLVQSLIYEAAHECRLTLDDYEKPDAVIEVKRMTETHEEVPWLATLLEVETDETTVEFIHDRMLDEFGPHFRASLDAAGRPEVRVASWNDGLLDSY